MSLGFPCIFKCSQVNYDPCKTSQEIQIFVIGHYTNHSVLLLLNDAPEHSGEFQHENVSVKDFPPTVEIDCGFGHYCCIEKMIQVFVDKGNVGLLQKI
jgi:hypothetical protein